MEIEFFLEAILEILIIYKPSMDYVRVPHTIWARSVQHVTQPFCSAQKPNSLNNVNES